MNRRRIQLIAGMTYSLSLPKQWVLKNNLKEKDEVAVYEKGDRTLLISPDVPESKKPNQVRLNIDEYSGNVAQVLFAVYYLGVENIVVFSKKEMNKEARSQIKRVLQYMSGTEIENEDKQHISIKVFLDKSKVDIIQILYRITLIIELSINCFVENVDITEIRNNENEIDRLYHLITKIITLSLIDSNILHSSKINNVLSIPSFLLIGKKLENTADSIAYLAEYCKTSKIDFENKKEMLVILRDEINRSISHILKGYPSIFNKINSNNLRMLNNHANKIRDKRVNDYLRDLIRYLIDIQQEIVNLSFYNSIEKNT